MVCDTLIHFGTKKKILSFCFFCPFMNSRFSIYLIMCCIQFNRIVMLHIMLKKIFFFCFRRIYFPYPFRTSPFSTTQVYFSIFNRFTFQYLFITCGFCWQ